MGAEIHSALERAQTLGEVGVQVAAYLNGQLIVDAWIGDAGDAEDSDSVCDATLFPIFSVTKAVTATALHIQAERGLIDYDAPVATYWPEYGTRGKERVTVRQVLTHRAGVPAMPSDVTPERLTDWEWMTSRLAEMELVYPPGTRNSYLAYVFGWLVGEVVRRTDSKQRSFNIFVQEEICKPLGLDSFWLGVPDDELSRVARLSYPVRPLPASADSLRALAVPPQVAFLPEIYNRRDVQQACIPGSGGIANARSVARFFAMLANRGELEGVRLLSESCVLSALEPRPQYKQQDETYGGLMPVGMGGFQLEERGVINHRAESRILCNVGAGSSLGWADVDSGLALAICHNRMVSLPEVSGADAELAPLAPLGDAIRDIAERRQNAWRIGNESGLRYAT